MVLFTRKYMHIVCITEPPSENQSTTKKKHSKKPVARLTMSIAYAYWPALSLCLQHRQ